MFKRLGLLFALFSFAPSLYAETLADWVLALDQPQVQKKILDLIFSNVGSVSSAKRDTQVPEIYIFPTNGSWVRLAQGVAWDEKVPYLVVTVQFSHAPERDPINSTSYLLRNTTRRPKAISAGYAMYERVQKVDLPLLKKSFLMLENASSRGPAKGQWSAALIQVDTSGDQRTVWQSPNSARRFQVGFDAVGGQTEALVFRHVPRYGGDPEYSAYRWNSNRFEPDSFVFESRLKALPNSVWQFGAPL
jgi:hypothetical protein